MKFAHIGQRLFNVPVALHPDKAEIVIAALADRLGITQLFRIDGSAAPLAPMAFDEDDWAFRQSATEPDCGYDLVNGIAIVPVHGTLVQRLGTLRPYSGMMGYDGIRQNVMTALSDPAVRAIALDIDSPGGEVAGCFDLADAIYAARGDKPIWAILDESAFSAAYALASAADRIIVPRTGGTGSIGVIMMHVDWSQALANTGIKVTFIQYGAAKADGHPEIPLSDDARARYQAAIDTMGNMFVETVARNRGLSVDTVRGTEAATFLGAEGVDLGLADAVMAPDAAFRSLLDTLT